LENNCTADVITVDAIYANEPVVIKKTICYFAKKKYAGTGGRPDKEIFIIPDS
jgi:hypothetical protein